MSELGIRGTSPLGERNKDLAGLAACAGGDEAAATSDAKVAVDFSGEGRESKEDERLDPPLPMRIAELDLFTGLEGGFDNKGGLSGGSLWRPEELSLRGLA